MERGRAKQITQDSLTGAIIAALCGVTGHMLGVQQLIRIPDLALYLPAALAGAVIGPTRLRPLLWVAAVPLSLTALLVAYTPLVRVSAPAFIRSDPQRPHVDAVVVLGS